MRLLSEFQKYNFFRTPTWRWDRILKIVDRYPTPGKASKRDDHWIKEARAFICKWRHAEEDEDKERLWMDAPALFYAYDLFAKRNDYPQGAAFIEARLLAGQSPEVIAKCMSTIPATVEWYEALFFNVSPYLEHRDWVTSAVLMPAIMKYHGMHGETQLDDTPLPFRDITVAKPFLDSTLKFFAYFGGPFLVDVMISGFQAGKKLTSSDGLNAWFDEHITSTIRRRTAQAAMSFEINKYNATELLAVHSRIMEIERSEESKDQARTTTERHIKAMVDGIPWLVGDKGAKVLKGTALGRLDSMSGELRDDEVLWISSGKPVPGLKDNFPEKLPPPKTKASKLLGLKEDDL